MHTTYSDSGIAEKYATLNTPGPQKVFFSYHGPKWPIWTTSFQILAKTLFWVMRGAASPEPGGGGLVVWVLRKYF